MEKNKSVLRGVRSNLLSPYSPVITLLIGLFLTLLATGENLPWYIKIFVDNKTILLLVIIFWLIIAVMHTIYESDLNSNKEEILKLNESIKEKNNQLNQSSGIILNKYGEFARFNKINRFEEILKSFVENNIGVDAAQIYKYSSKISGEIMKIRINYEEGFAYEDVDINGLLQAYYTIDVEYFNKISDFLGLWSELINDENISSFKYEVLEDKVLKSAEELLTYLVGELNSITEISEIKEFHYTYYRILILLINLIGQEKTFKGVLGNEEVEEYLIQGKRTGILGAILLKDNYIFKHVGKSSKNGRMYMSFPIKLYDERYVVLIAISPSLLNDVREWDRALRKFKNDFILRVNDTN